MELSDLANASEGEGLEVLEFKKKLYTQLKSTGVVSSLKVREVQLAIAVHPPLTLGCIHRTYTRDCAR